MDFAFNEEQEMLRDQARGFLSSKFPADERIADPAPDPAWGEVAELGWLGLSVDEERGGAGMGFLEEAVLFEEMGRALYPGPYLSAVGLALPALTDETLEKVVSGKALATFAWQEPSTRISLGDLEGLGTKAESSDGGWTLTGEKHLVTDASRADVIVVAAQTTDGPALFEVDASDVKVEVSETIDETRPVGRLSLSGTSGRLAVQPGSVSDVVRRIRLRALAALSLEAVGVAQQVLDLAKSHAGERKQFDKPIGVYQAVSHQIANTYMATELARSLAYWAAWCVSEDHEQVDQAVAAAKAAASEAAVEACERSIQVHGGIGFTWEHVLHRYYKRAQGIAAFDGSPASHRAAVANSLLG